MKLYQAVDKLDNKESFFLVYPDQSVAVMLVTDVKTVKRNARRYLTNPSLRFDDAINPVLVEEW